MAQKGRVSMLHLGRTSLWNTTKNVKSSTQPYDQAIAVKQLLHAQLQYDAYQMYMFKDSALFYGLSTKFHVDLLTDWRDEHFKIFGEKYSFEDECPGLDDTCQAYNMCMDATAMTPQILRSNTCVIVDAKYIKPVPTTLTTQTTFFTTVEAFLEIWSCFGVCVYTKSSIDSAGL